MFEVKIRGESSDRTNEFCHAPHFLTRADTGERCGLVNGAYSTAIEMERYATLDPGPDSDGVINLCRCSYSDGN